MGFDDIRCCFLCQQERTGTRRCVTVSTFYYSGRWNVREWIHIRCFCCDACAAAWRWHYAKRVVLLLLSAVLVSAIISGLMLFLPASELKNPWVWWPVAISLGCGLLGSFGWYVLQDRKMIHPDSRRKLETLIGASYFQVRVRDRVPLGEKAIDDQQLN